MVLIGRHERLLIRKHLFTFCKHCLSERRRRLQHFKITDSWKEKKKKKINIVLYLYKIRYVVSCSTKNACYSFCKIKMYSTNNFLINKPNHIIFIIYDTCTSQINKRCRSTGIWLLRSFSALLSASYINMTLFMMKWKDVMK